MMNELLDSKEKLLSERALMVAQAKVECLKQESLFQARRIAEIVVDGHFKESDEQPNSSDLKPLGMCLKIHNAIAVAVLVILATLVIFMLKY